ncbi:MAG: tetratricopeptide repeat protein, partial [Candidatus Omnitrophica bacterium]|nr:tetratricopeptide repeat protein [Candidatus Omnitrophota bacterium]
MKKIFFIFIVLFIWINPSYSYWIWTPKTRKWINPKTQAKSTPEDQLNYALEFYKQKKYEEARQEFNKLIKIFPRSREASEAQYYLGLIEEELGNLYEAYKAYQKVIDKYPFSERIQEIIEREYKIAERFMSGYRRKIGGVPLPVENPAIEIFTKVIENSTYGPLAASSQYKVGLILKSLGRYSEAEEAFNKVINNYPESEWVVPAKFQLAECRANLARGADYDQYATSEAKERFKEFLREHPDAVLSEEAEKNIKSLDEREAEADFKTALFYEKQKAYRSAKIYYEGIIKN